MEKRVLDRRLKQMINEGVEFKTNANVGDNIKVEEIQDNF